MDSTDDISLTLPTPTGTPPQNPHLVLTTEEKAALAVDDANRTFNFGDVITRDWMDEAFGTIIPDILTKKEYIALTLDFLSGWEVFTQGLLQNHKKVLHSLGGGRWRIVLPENQASFALRVASKKITKAIAVAKDVQMNTRTDLLNAAQQAAHYDNVGKMAALEALGTRKK